MCQEQNIFVSINKWRTHIYENAGERANYCSLRTPSRP